MMILRKIHSRAHVNFLKDRSRELNIKNDQELLDEIKKILGSIQAEARQIEGPHLGAFITIHTNLIKIEQNVNNRDYSIESKQDCNMSGPLAYLYEGMKVLPTLGLILCNINEYYQAANIKTLRDEDAGMYFLYKG